jgi:hypothetical protein
MFIVLDWLLLVIVSITIYMYTMDPPPPPTNETTEKDDYAEFYTSTPAENDCMTCVDDRLSPLSSLYSQLTPPSGAILPEPTQFNKALIILQSLDTLPPALVDYLSLNLRKAMKYDNRRGKVNGSPAAVLQYYDAVMAVLKSVLSGEFDPYRNSFDAEAWQEMTDALMETLEDDEEFITWDYKLRALKIVRHDIRWQQLYKAHKHVRNALKACESLLDYMCKTVGDSDEHRVIVDDVMDRLAKAKQSLAAMEEPLVVMVTNKPLLTVSATEYTKTRMRSLSQSMKWPAGHAVVKTA